MQVFCIVCFLFSKWCFSHKVQHNWVFSCSNLPWILLFVLVHLRQRKWNSGTVVDLKRKLILVRLRHVVLSHSMFRWPLPVTQYSTHHQLTRNRSPSPGRRRSRSPDMPEASDNWTTRFEFHPGRTDTKLSFCIVRRDFFRWLVVI